MGFFPPEKGEYLSRICEAILNDSELESEF